MCERYLASRQGRSEVHAADALNNLNGERELTLLATDQSPVVCRFLHVLRPIVLLGQFLREGGIMSSVAGSGSRRVGSSRVSKQTQLYRWQCVSWREVCREAVPEMSGPHWADLMLECTHLLKLNSRMKMSMSRITIGAATERLYLMQRMNSLEFNKFKGQSFLALCVRFAHTPEICPSPPSPLEQGLGGRISTFGPRSK